MSQYEKLIKEVYDELDKPVTCSGREYYDLFINNSNYPHLEEHNLWTYWQGRGVRNPKIMVVGQDWGSIEQSKHYYEYIHNHPDAKVVSYVQIREEYPALNGSEFTTDKELRRFFEEYLGYKDICKCQYHDVYFTNLIPGYRNSNCSVGNSSEAQKGVTDRVIEDFKKILLILKPQVIICLGRIVGESIAKAYDKNSRVVKEGSFNLYLDEQLNKENPKPMEINIGNGHCIKMFTISHLGSLGKANRTRYFNENQINKTIEDDWMVVADYIKKMPNIKLEEAIHFATKCHSGQTRKGSATPFILHPLEVMQLLAGMNADTNLLIAGLLHDVVEDTEVGIDEIRNIFGEDVGNLVAGHSEDKTKTWQERKQTEIDATFRADIRMKKLVLADKLANMRSIYKDYNEIGEKLWSRFNAGKEKQKWYYGKMVESLASMQEEKDATIYYRELIMLYKDVFREN